MQASDQTSHFRAQRADLSLNIVTQCLVIEHMLKLCLQIYSKKVTTF